MKKFDVLDPKLNVRQSWFVEASAGTGKTFAIAHLVARLVQEHQIPLEKIAVMTFTRAAAKELRQRIGAVLPLADLDAAPIGTIHGICLRYLDETAGDVLKTVERRLHLIQKVLREGAGLRPSQLRRLVRQSEEELVRQLLRSNDRPERAEVALGPIQLDRQLLADQLGRYRGMLRRDGSLHEEVQRGIDSTQDGWDWALGDGFDLLKKMDEGQLRSGQQGQHPVVEALRQPVLRAMDRDQLLKVVQGEIWERMEQIRLEEGWIDPDGIIEAALKVRPSGIEALIVDEFQDTDPKQWQLICNWAPPLLYLVGDPKQSIYAFRKADLYTYLSARDSFSPEQRGTLAVNYRSCAPLVEGINRLFAGTTLFKLPRLNSSLQVDPVESGAALEPIQDGGAAIQWLESDNEEQQLDWVCDELISVGVPFGSCAILVRDRFQAAVVSQALQKRGIPYLAASTDEALESVQLLLDAVANPHSGSRLRALLLSPLMGIPPEQLRGLEMVEEMQRLRQIWHEKGAVALLHEALYSRWTEPTSLKERLLQMPRLLADLERMMELLAQADLTPGNWQPQWETVKAHWWMQEKNLEGDSVVISTIHGAKGLQWDLVFALGVVRKRADEGAEEEAEWVRQLYVAATRPRRRLYLPAGVMEQRAGELVQCSERRATQSPSATPSVESVDLSAPTAPPSPRLLSFTALKGRTQVTGGVAGGRQLGTQFHELVHRCLERRQIESAEEPMREWLYNALHTPLPQIGPVWDLPRHTIWSEMEFGLLEEGNILRGAMDLVIRHATGWYLIDWKTNQLPSYDAPALREAMERGHYLDQAQLYGRALQRWISQVAPGEKLAGVYYLFVRGPGVFHVGA